jgi:hypothetical protein
MPKHQMKTDFMTINYSAIGGGFAIRRFSLAPDIILDM